MKVKYTKVQIAMEIVGLIIVLGMVAFVFIRWNQIPEKVPGHYNALGEVDRWGSKTEVFIMPIVGTLLYVFISILSFFPQIWNVPQANTREKKEAVYICARSLIISTKIEMIALFSYINCYTVTAQPLPGAFLPVVLCAMFGTMTFFVIQMYRVAKKDKPR